MAEIELSRGAVALLDDDWHRCLGVWNWYLLSNGQGYFYGYRQVTPFTCGKRLSLLMHRLVVGLPKGYEIIHENGNTLDCRGENLTVYRGEYEILWRSSAGKSDFVGVVWDGYYGLWRAEIARMTVGYFCTELEAALAYNNKVVELNMQSLPQNKIGFMEEEAVV